MIDKVKKYLKKVGRLLNTKELKILPSYLSYSFVLAIIPILTIMIMIAGLFSISIDNVISLINDILPSYASREVIKAISGTSFDFSIGLLNVITFIFASNGAYAIITAANSLYKIEEKSPIKDRLKSVLILFLLIGLLLFLVLVPMLGGKILHLLGNYKVFYNILDELVLIYKIVKWPITLLIIFFTIKLIYKIAPSAEVKMAETTLGALFTTLGWAIFTAIFGYYVKYFARYDLFYGSLSSLIILLIWIFVLSFILVLGMVINSTKYNKT